MTTIKRIGFACKWIDHPDQVNGIKPTDDCKKYNTGTTTVSWLNRQSKDVAEKKLWDLMIQNIQATKNLIERVGSLDEHLRMVRISSDVLPVYTHCDYKHFWNQRDVQDHAARHFEKVGSLARHLGIRMSFHSGLYTVLASDRDDVVKNSLEEFEYHADLVRWMGYGKLFQDFKINVHISGKRGTQGIRDIYGKLSPEARNCITIENEEMTYGLEDTLSLMDLVPTVMDIHHHWVREGEYIQPNDDRIKKVLDSWRGHRPTMHYSISREDCLPNHDPNCLPEHRILLESGNNKQKLRAHSDFYWNNAANDWALSFNDQFDIMCESKGKNLASFKLYDQLSNG